MAKVYEVATAPPCPICETRERCIRRYDGRLGATCGVATCRTAMAARTMGRAHLARIGRRGGRGGLRRSPQYRLGYSAGWAAGQRAARRERGAAVESPGVIK
jgi:hypothetical protein